MLLLALAACGASVYAVLESKAVHDTADAAVVTPGGTRRVLGAGGHAGRGDIDPFRPPGLPEGVTIDPETGLMVGFTPRGTDGTTFVTWTSLVGPDYQQPVAELPEHLRALEGKQVSMIGFMVAIYKPTDMREFLLVGSHLACCFGQIPGPEGIVEVATSEAQGLVDATYEPVLVRGRLALDPIVEQGRGGEPARTLLVFRLRDAELKKLSELY